MRKNVEVLWLDDELSGFSHKRRKAIVIDLLAEKGYVADIIEFEDFNSAYKELSSTKRYDFFISDYNLNDSETGLSYLEKIREKN
ncbi:response regulator, partial [Enterococcus faecalis]|nr:response regulator [Enterococcus faecalis]